MKTLEGEAALNYLKDLRSVLHPEDDDVANVAILRSMVDLKTIQLERTANTSANKLIIGPHGFPDFLPWIVDTITFFDEYDALTTKRARETKPLAQAFIDASPEALIEAAKRIADSCDENTLMIDAIQKISVYRKDLVNAAKYQLNDFPLIVTPENPGVIAGLTVENYYKYFKYAFKYIGRSLDKKVPRSPALLLFRKESNNKTNFEYVGGVSTPKLHSLSAYIGGEKGCKDKKEDFTFYLVRSKELHPLLGRLYADTDFTNLSDSEINGFLSVLSLANLLAEDTQTYWRKLVANKPTNDKDYILSTADDVARRTSDLYASVNNPLLRLKLQNAIAEIVKPVKEDIDKKAKISVVAPPSTKTGVLGRVRRLLPGS